MKKYQLMAPGPTPVPPNVLLAMAQPMIHHRTPEYDALFAEVRAGLKRLFQTRQEVIPFTSSGTGAMEAAVANTLSAGDTALILRAGKFGERWEEIARAYGITVVPVTAPFGQTVSAEQMGEALRRHPAAKAVLMQHSESSTGVLHDVRGIAGVTRDTGAICVVDAVSSLGIADLPMDAWGADVVVAGSQKGLMLPPGLSFCALSEKAWGHVKRSTLPKYYFDLTAEAKAVSKGEAHFTPAVSIMLGLLPVSGREGFANLILPALTLGGGLAATTTRMVRGSMLEEIRQDYVRTARAKGLGAGAVLFGHALRNGLIPIVTVLGLQAGMLLAGAIVTERIFSWPGLEAAAPSDEMRLVDILPTILTTMGIAFDPSTMDGEAVQLPLSQ